MHLKTKTLSHIAISCSNIETSLAFYRDQLGFNVNDALGSVKGNVKLNIGNGTYLELFPFNVYQSSLQGTLAHFAIEVQSIDDTLAFLEEKSIPVLRGPFTLNTPSGSLISKVVFILGPDQEEIEFVERATQQY